MGKRRASIAVGGLLAIGSAFQLAPVLVVALAAQPELSNAAGFVTRDGPRLMLDGKPFRFTGLNIYNANSINNCGYTLGTGPGLDQSLAAIGPGQEVFRAWFYQSEAILNGHRDWSAFDHTLSVARAHGEKVIATLADQWGDCEQPGSRAYKNESWYRSGYKTAVQPGSLTSYRTWVTEIVSRYQHNPMIMAWQLMNEAEDATSFGGSCPETASATLKSFTADMASLVKGIDRNHLLSLGTIGSGQCGSGGLSYFDLHSVPGIDLCEYHDYGYPLSPMPGDIWNGLQAHVAACTLLNKPSFVGETGTQTSQAGSLSNRASGWRAKFKAQFAAGVVGELIWNWRDAAHGGSSLTGYDVGPGDPALQNLTDVTSPIARSIPR